MTDDTHGLDLTADEKKLLLELIREEEAELDSLGQQRRHFLKQLVGAGGALLALQLFGEQSLSAHATPSELPPGSVENALKIALRINGSSKTLEIDPRMTLLDVLRERLALTGSKKGCDHGQCGACTVIVSGKRVLSCLTMAASCQGKTIETIEGFARAGKLHPMQAAFLKHDGFQCGFCTPGQICSGIALVNEVNEGEASYVTKDLKKPFSANAITDEEIRERMSGNICRCGAYTNIVAAIREVLTGTPVAQEWLSAPQETDGFALGTSINSQNLHHP